MRTWDQHQRDESRDRRIAELKSQVAYEQERNLLNVAQHTDRIKELEAELATIRELKDFEVEKFEVEKLVSRDLRTELAEKNEKIGIITQVSNNETRIVYELEADNARLQAALKEVEYWSNAHLGWSVSLAGHVDGVYEEIAKVGRIAREALK